MKKPVAQRLRRWYRNEKYPLVLLRFEDGHEIQLKRGESKSFDAYAGEHIRVVVLWDPSINEREVVATMKAEDFDEEKK